MARIKLKLGENELEVDSRDFYVDNQTLGEIIGNISQYLPENQAKIVYELDSTSKSNSKEDALECFDEVENFYFALISSGLGWNFGFIGATSLLTTTHTIEVRAKVQALNDVLVSGLVTIASFGSGAILQIYGWKYVQYAMIPALSLAVMAILWLAIKTRRARSIEPNFGGMW